MKETRAARTPVRTKWTTLVTVCRECDGGKSLAKTVRQAVKDAAGREVRVVSSSCLDVCPKRGVTVATLGAGGVTTAVVDSSLAARAAYDAVFPDLAH
jgi:predicted metal-binding protein